MDTKANIMAIFKNVPRLGDSWKYIPLSNLPINTKIIIVLKDTPFVENEENLILIPSGRYELTVKIWPTVLFSPYKNKSILIKPYFRILAPTAPLVANFDKKLVTYKLTTAPVYSIIVEGTNIRLNANDKPKQKRKFKRYGYRPLIRRKF